MESARTNAKFCDNNSLFLTKKTEFWGGGADYIIWPNCQVYQLKNAPCMKISPTIDVDCQISSKDLPQVFRDKPFDDFPMIRFIKHILLMAWQRFHNVFTNIKDDNMISFLFVFFLLFSLSHKSHFYIIAGYPPGT